MLHELYFPLTAHKNRKCIRTASSCCNREVAWWASDGSKWYRMNFLAKSIASLAVILQGQSWKVPFWLLFPMEQTNVC